MVRPEVGSPCLMFQHDETADTRNPGNNLTEPSPVTPIPLRPWGLPTLASLGCHLPSSSSIFLIVYSHSSWLSGVF